MDIIKRYWWCFLIALILTPIILNFVLLIPAFTPIVGDNNTWLMFLGSLIGALASFIMIFFTALTLKQNKEQLEVLKKQWREEHTPIIVCELVPYDKTRELKLHVYNPTNVVADNVLITINNYLEEIEFSETEYGSYFNSEYITDVINFVRTQKFILPPKGDLYFFLGIPVLNFNTLNGYIEVTIEVSGISKRKF